MICFVIPVEEICGADSFIKHKQSLGPERGKKWLADTTPESTELIQTDFDSLCGCKGLAVIL